MIIMNGRDYRNIREAKRILKNERFSDSKEYMIEQIVDIMDSLKGELDESVTKVSLVDLLEALSGITLMTEEKEVKEIKRPMDYGGEDEYSERSRGGDFDGRGTRV